MVTNTQYIIGLIVDEEFDNNWVFSDNVINRMDLIHSIVQIHMNQVVPNILIRRMPFSFAEICSSLNSSITSIVILAPCLKAYYVDEFLRGSRIPIIVIPYPKCDLILQKKFSNSTIILSPDEYSFQKSIYSIISKMRLSKLGIWTIFPSSSKKLIDTFFHEDRTNYPKIEIYESFYNMSNSEDLKNKLQFYLLNLSSIVELLIVNIPNSNLLDFLNQTYNSSIIQSNIGIIFYNDDDPMSTFLPVNSMFTKTLVRPSLMLLRSISNAMQLKYCSPFLQMNNGEFYFLNAMGYCNIPDIPERSILGFLSIYYLMMGITNTTDTVIYSPILCGSFNNRTNSSLLGNFVKEVLSTSGLINTTYMQSTFTNDLGNETVFQPTVKFTNSSKNMTIYDSQIFPNKFHSFYGRMLIIDTIISPPLAFAGTTGPDGFMYNVTGYSIDLLDEIARRLNFTYKLRQPNDQQYGSYVGNGTWSGMVGEIIAKKVDMAIGPITIILNRTSVVDFTEFYSLTGMSILITRPKYQSNAFKILTPFTLGSWITIVVSIFVVGTLMFLISYYSPLSEFNLNSEFGFRDEISFIQNNWSAIGSFLMQGQDFYPRANSTRIVLAFWWFFAILINATYNADLTAYLANRTPMPSIQSLEDLANSPTMKPLIKAGTNAVPLFVNAAPDSIYGRLYAKMKDMPYVTTNPVAIDMIRNDSSWALIGDSSITNYYGVIYCQEFQVLPVQFNIAGYGWILPKGSKYTGAINQGFSSLKESGFIQKLALKWWQSATICGNQNMQTSTLTVGETAGVFIILAMFIVLGAILLIIEIIMLKGRKKKVIDCI